MTEPVGDTASLSDFIYGFSDIGAARRFRFNPSFELVQWERLPADLREASGDLLREEPDLFGLVQSKETAGPQLTVGRDLALLLLSLQTPGPLPRFALGGGETAVREDILRLLLDGLLEIESGAGFVSGARACAQIWPDWKPREVTGTIEKLSRDALEYATALSHLPLGLLVARLYAYPRLVFSPRGRLLMPASRLELREHLGVRRGSARWHKLKLHWEEQRGAADSAWISWRRRNPVEAEEANRFKLYVSPRTEALGDCIEVISEELHCLGAGAFKVTAEPLGLLRPDKMVVYFSDFDKLACAGRVLAGRLAGLPAHGVPFTAAVERDGLLSWGIDPSVSRATPGAPRESWRSWLVSRLAHTLKRAGQAAETTMPPWLFALKRLELEGVDTRRWVPRSTKGTFWQTGFGES